MPDAVTIPQEEGRRVRIYIGVRHCREQAR